MTLFALLHFASMSGASSDSRSRINRSSRFTLPLHASRLRYHLTRPPRAPFLPAASPGCFATDSPETCALPKSRFTQLRQDIPLSARDVFRKIDFCPRQAADFFVADADLSKKFKQAILILHIPFIAINMSLE